MSTNKRVEIIVISSYSSSDLESSNGPFSFDFSLDISSEEIVYSSPDIEVKKGKATSKAKPSFSSIEKAKASILAKASGSSSSKAKASKMVKSLVPIRNYVIGLANARTWYSILNKTLGVKIPTFGTSATHKKEKRKIGG
ncbi:hypothetical protein Tco_1050872 [Tanacetum coccineum]